MHSYTTPETTKSKTTKTFSPYSPQSGLSIMNSSRTPRTEKIVFHNTVATKCYSINWYACMYGSDVPRGTLKDFRRAMANVLRKIKDSATNMEELRHELGTVNRFLRDITKKEAREINQELKDILDAYIQSHEEELKKKKMRPWYKVLHEKSDLMDQHAESLIRSLSDVVTKISRTNDLDMAKDSLAKMILELKPIVEDDDVVVRTMDVLGGKETVAAAKKLSAELGGVSKNLRTFIQSTSLSNSHKNIIISMCDQLQKGGTCLDGMLVKIDEEVEKSVELKANIASILKKPAEFKGKD